MSAAAFFHDLALVLLTAAAVLIVFKKLKQPPILGYLAAGLILGPYTPPHNFISDVHSLEILSEVGVVFLLFALGVDFNLRRLAKVGAAASGAALIEAFLMIMAGLFAGAWFGWPFTGSFLFGGIIALSSTAIVSRVLLDQSKQDSGWESLASGKLVAEDVIAVLLIAVFSSSSGGYIHFSNILDISARFVALTTALLILGLLVAPRLLRLVEKSGMDEVRTLVVVGVCFGMALITGKLGFSPALGAFLAGAVFSEAAGGKRLHEIVTPFRDVFGAVFFVAVGMLIDPQWLLLQEPLILGLLAFFVVAARLGVNFFAVLAMGRDKESALRVAAATLPIGEFSFLLAQTARESTGNTRFYPLAVALCLATTLAHSAIYPAALHHPDKILRWFPEFLNKSLEFYHSALKRLSASGKTTLLWRILRPSVIQIVLNFFGLSALFLGAQALEDRQEFFQNLPGLLWVLSTLIGLPFLLALWRKSHAVVLILLEAATTKNPGDASTLHSHTILIQSILGSVTCFVLLWYLSLSWALLPPWPYMIIPVALALMSAAFLWRRMKNLYTLIQVDLRSTLSHADESHIERAKDMIEKL